MRLFIAAVGVLLLFTQSSAMAVDNNDQIYIGLNWQFGGSHVPELVMGYRSARIDKHGNVNGADVNIGFMTDKGSASNVRARYFHGGEDLQGEGGMGFKLGEKTFFAVFGVQAPYVRANIDFIPGISYSPQLEVNTIGKYKQEATNIVVAQNPTPPPQNQAQ